MAEEHSGPQAKERELFESHDDIARKLGIQADTPVLDIGGAGARFTHGDITIVDIQTPDWEHEKFLRHDICRDPLPFADGEFEVCICTQTLEDLYNPFLALDEMQRVAKRGYIETPHRGLESSFSVSSHLGTYPGWGHHRWMFETVGERVVKVMPKFWQLMRHDAEQIMLWTGPRSWSFYWEGSFEHYNTEVVDPKGHGWDRLMDDHNEFVQKNRQWARTLADYQAEAEASTGAATPIPTTPVPAP